MNKNVLRRIASLQLQGKDDHKQDLLAIVDNDAKTLQKWSAPLTKEERMARDNAIIDHWASGETAAVLAQKSHLDRRLVDRMIKKGTSLRLASMSLTETPPIYNVWNYGTCDPRFGQKHPGQIPGQAVLNLVLWLTEPLDFVVDPMAGGGTTVDVCKYSLRRYRSQRRRRSLLSGAAPVR